MVRLMQQMIGAVAVMAAATGVHGQTLLENGSFELSRNQNPRNTAVIAQSTQIDSWTIAGANGVMYVDAVMNASSGSRFVQLQFITANYIQQTIATVPGQFYRVYFDASAYVGPNGAGARLMRGKATARSSGDGVIASKDFSYDGTGKSFPSVGWNSFTFDFRADSAVTAVRWESSETGNNGGPCVDNARVVPGHNDGNGEWIISGPPVFSQILPATSQAVVGRPLSLNVDALGDGPLGFQWYRVNNTTFTPIPGATAAIYEIPSFANNLSGTYAVIVTNEFAAITNRTSIVRVSAPVISGQPEEQHVTVGSTLNFGPTSFSGSAPDRFQWYKDGISVPGQTNQSFYKQAVEASDAGAYSVRVANIAGETNSLAVPVFVFNEGVPPWIKFNQLPARRAVQEGSSLFLTVGGQGAPIVNYFWYKDGQVIGSGAQNNFSINATTLADTGKYWAVLSNAFGKIVSSNMDVIVYPPQQPPQFKVSYVSTNAGEGMSITIAPELIRGTKLSFQWYKRPLTVFNGLGDPIPGANGAELAFGLLRSADAGNYTLVATNFVGTSQITYALDVIAKPVFASPLQGFEGPEGSLVQLSVSIQNFAQGQAYQWFKDGQPLTGATQSTYQLTASPTSVGNYSVAVRNNAGESTSNLAPVVLREITPAEKQFKLVADYTIDAPSRTSSKLGIVSDAHLRSGIVTFQSKTNYDDVGGLYRWESGNAGKIADLHDPLPSLPAEVTHYDGLSAEEDGAANFLATSTNAVGSQVSVFDWKNGTKTAIATQESAIPGKTGVRIKRYGYTTRAGGKTAFFGMESDTGAGGYRCVLVWDGSTLQNWANSDQPLPAGDGLWWGNSAQVGFDGRRLAFWVYDKLGESGGRNGLVTSLNGGALEKIGFTGDPIPGAVGSFRSFNSPPLVHEGRVLFLAQSENSNANMLLEYASGALRVIARSGDAAAGAGAFTSLQYGFDYLADGSILFTANGPGQKQGIYQWNNGAITEALTTLNTINGRLVRFVSLSDADGMDCLISASFDGSRFGLYTTASANLPSEKPALSLSASARSMTLHWTGAGVLQESVDLQTWKDLNVLPPFEAFFAASPGKYFRLMQR